jgi:prepilin-type N-terminal cleavage/methylation domain-containing protein
MRTRKGFTLIELMVAMALTLFIMVILTQAFVLSIDAFRGLKGIGDMQANLRTGANTLRFDLSQAHFEGARRPNDAGRPGEGFLATAWGFAQVCTTTAGSNAVTGGSTANMYVGMNVAGPPGSGIAAGTKVATIVSATSITISIPAGATGNPLLTFFGPTLATPEGSDADTLLSSRSFSVLHLSSRLKANFQQAFYSTSVNEPPNGLLFTAQTSYNLPPDAAADANLRDPNTSFFRSQWAEIAYFLVQTGTTEEPLNPNGGSGTPLYGLYRAQFGLVTDNTNLANPPGPYPAARLNDFLGMACNRDATGTNLVFFTPNDLAALQGAVRTRTFDPSAITPRAAALVVPNVLSFQVQGIGITPDVTGGAPVSVDDYDSAKGSPLGLRGVAITLRVWDNKTRQTRQLSILQDL